MTLIDAGIKRYLSKLPPVSLESSKPVNFIKIDEDLLRELKINSGDFEFHEKRKRYPIYPENLPDLDVLKSPFGFERKPSEKNTTLKFHTQESLAQLRQDDLPEYVRTVRGILEREAISNATIFKAAKMILNPDFERQETDRAEAAVLKIYGIKLADFRRDELSLLKSSNEELYFKRCFAIAEEAVSSNDIFIVKFHSLQAEYNKDEFRRSAALREYGLELSEVRKEYAEYLRKNKPEQFVSLVLGEYSSFYGRQLKDDLVNPKIFWKVDGKFNLSHENQYPTTRHILNDVLAKYSIEPADFLATLAKVTKVAEPASLK